MTPLDAIRTADFRLNDASAQSIIAALDRAGFVIVPKEPSAARMQAGDDAYVASTFGNRCYGGLDGVVCAYRAMVYLKE
jgi:hypothetical protein